MDYYHHRYPLIHFVIAILIWYDNNNHHPPMVGFNNYTCMIKANNMINIYKASSTFPFIVTDLLLIWYCIIIIRQRQSPTCCHRNRQDIKISSLYGRTTCFIPLLLRSSRNNTNHNSSSSSRYTTYNIISIDTPYDIII